MSWDIISEHGGACGTRLGYSIHIHCTKGMLEYNLADGKLYLHKEINEEKSNMDTSSKLEILMTENDRSKKTQFETRHSLNVS